jgi:hypothetical protein
MRGLALLSLAVVLCAAVAVAFASGPPTLPAPAWTTFTGTVASVSVDTNGNLLSFVLDVPGKGMPSPLTISVTDQTQYFVGGQAGTSADVVVGAQVVVKLTAAPVDGAGTAAVVEIFPSQ